MQYRNIALTGASSGLGRALALELAAPGVTLHLCGRDATRLSAVAAEVRARGAGATEILLDVTNRDDMDTWVRGIPGLDLTIANAGISAGPGQGHFESSAQIRSMFATNVDGAFNTVLPALARRCRHIAIIGSIAGLIALPSSPPIARRKRRWISGCGE
jgi:NADP-dependent 3-hydroxy acid dehydrogenase YdfG